MAFLGEAVADSLTASPSTSADLSLMYAQNIELKKSLETLNGKIDQLLNVFKGQSWKNELGSLTLDHIPKDSEIALKADGIKNLESELFNRDKEILELKDQLKQVYSEQDDLIEELSSLEDDNETLKADLEAAKKNEDAVRRAADADPSTKIVRKKIKMVLTNAFKEVQVEFCENEKYLGSHVIESIRKILRRSVAPIEKSYPTSEGTVPSAESEKCNH